MTATPSAGAAEAARRLVGAGALLISGVPAAAVASLAKAIADEVQHMGAEVLRLPTPENADLVQAVTIAEDGLSSTDEQAAAEAIIYAESGDEDTLFGGPFDVAFGSWATSQEHDSGALRLGAWISCAPVILRSELSVAFSDRSRWVRYADLLSATDVADASRALAGRDGERLALAYAHAIVTSASARLRLSSLLESARSERDTDQRLRPLVEISGGQAALSAMPAGIAATLAAVVHLGAPGVSPMDRAAWLAARLHPSGATVWVDPYFAPCADRFGEPLRRMLSRLGSLMSDNQHLIVLTQRRAPRCDGTALQQLSQSLSQPNIEFRVHTGTAHRRYLHDRHLVALQPATVLNLPTVDRLLGGLPEGNYVEGSPTIHREYAAQLREVLAVSAAI